MPAGGVLNPANTTIAEKLRSVIFFRLENYMNKLFSDIKTHINEQLTKLAATTKSSLTDAQISLLTNFDCTTDDDVKNLSELQKIFGTIMINMRFEDTLTATPKLRTNSVTIETLCANLKLFKSQLTKQLGSVELFVSQSEFIKSYLAGIFDQKTMNVSTPRALFETITPESQCDESYGIPWPPGHGDLPPRFDSKYAWRKYCYICGLPITTETGKSQCEHILFVLQACGLKCLIQRRHIRHKTTGGEFDIKSMDALSQALYKLAYAGAHPCCNILKSNRKFIIINEDGFAKANDKEIKNILQEIQEHSIKNDGGLNCGSLNNIQGQGKNYPKDWNYEDITKRVKEIIELFVQPLVDKLNLRLTQVYSGSTNPEYNTKEVLELFVRMNHILSLEVSLEQVLSCILAGGEIKVPTSMILTSANSGIIDQKASKTLISDSYDSSSDGDFYLKESYGSIEGVPLLINTVKLFLTQQIKEFIRTLPARRTKSPLSGPKSAAKAATAPNPAAAAPNPAAAAPNSAPAAPNSAAESDTYYKAVTPGDDSSLQQLMLRPNGQSFTNALFKECFGIHTNMPSDIFDSTQFISGKPGDIFYKSSASRFPTKLSYYFRNFNAKFYSEIRPNVTASEKKELDTLCKSYIALEVMYTLTYNLNKNKKLKEALFPDPDLEAQALRIFEDCLVLYKTKYTDFMIRWFLYSSIDRIQKSGLDFLMEPEGMTEAERVELHSNIEAQCGEVYLNFLMFFKKNPARLAIALKIISSANLTSDNIDEYVTKAVKLLIINDEFKALIHVKHYIELVGYNTLLFKQLATPLGPVLGPAIQPALGPALGPMEGGGSSLKKSARRKYKHQYNTSEMTRKLASKMLKFKKAAIEKAAFNKFVNENEKIQEHMYSVDMLKVAVQHLRAYDVGSAFISKNSSISSSSKNPIEIGICAKLNSDITMIKQIIDSYMIQRAAYALNKLGICDNIKQATWYANAIAHGSITAINEIVQLMGVKLDKTMMEPKPPKVKPSLIFTLMLEPKRISKRRTGRLLTRAAAAMKHLTRKKLTEVKIVARTNTGLSPTSPISPTTPLRTPSSTSPRTPSPKKTVFKPEYIIQHFKGKRRMVNVDTGRSKRRWRYTSKSSTRKSQKRV